MEFKTFLNEMEAEIVGATIPGWKIFFNGAIVRGARLIQLFNRKVINGTTWRQVLNDILRKIKADPELHKKFKPDEEPLDINGSHATRTEKIMLTADDGDRFVYDLRTKKITGA